MGVYCQYGSFSVMYTATTIVCFVLPLARWIAKPSNWEQSGILLEAWGGGVVGRGEGGCAVDMALDDTMLEGIELICAL